MLGVSQREAEKLNTNKVVTATLIALLSFLAVNKRLPTTVDEVSFIQSFNSYRNRIFYFHKNLPLPCLMYYGIYRLSTYLHPLLFPLVFRNIRLVNFSVLVPTITGILWLSRKIYTGAMPWAVVLTYILNFAIDSSAILFTNDLFAVFFTVLGIIQMKKRHELAAGVFLGLSISSSWASLSVHLPLVVTSLTDALVFLADPVNKVHRAMFKMSKRILALILVPVLVYLTSFWIHYSLQEHVSESGSEFSIEFQSTLRSHTHEPADKYLMDRSVVTILNQKHRAYLNMEASEPFGCSVKDEGSMWTIVKVHLDESGGAKVGEEDRYVRDGDFVKIVGFNSNMCLRVVSDDSDDKFKKVLGFHQSGDSADEDDIWQIHGDGYVIARRSLVRFKHYKSSVDLCVRGLQRADDDSEAEDTDGHQRNRRIVSGSLYSESSSRLFYISDNRNHEFFKKNFEDGRPRESVLEFPKKSFVQKLAEHHTKLMRARKGTWSLFRKHILLPLPGRGHYKLEHNVFFDIASTACSFLLPILISANYIAHKKYGVKMQTERDTMVACVLYVCANAVELVLGTGQMFTSIIRIWVALAFMSLLGTKLTFAFLSVLLSTSVRFLGR